jgi:hypothetical protein
MAVYFSNALKNCIASTPEVLDGLDVRITILDQVRLRFDGEIGTLPVGEDGEHLDHLITVDGWREIDSARGFAPSLAVTSALQVVGQHTYLTIPSEFTFGYADMQPCEARAVVLFADSVDLGIEESDHYNIVLMITTTPCLTGIVRAGDVFTTRYDSTVSGNWLFRWSTGVTTPEAVSPDEGPTLFLFGTRPFEGAHVHNLWITPQRVNFIANPSFEASNTDHWITNSASNDYIGNGVDTYSSPFVGYFYGPSGSSSLPEYDPYHRLYVYSNSFNPEMLAQEHFTFQAKVAGHGILRAGVMWYDPYTEMYEIDWGLQDLGLCEEWDLRNSVTDDVDNISPPVVLQHIYGIRSVQHTESLRLVFEVRGYYADDSWHYPQLLLDEVLIEPGTLMGWPYFDGDSTYGMGIKTDANTSDFCWYGAGDLADKQGKSYSLWYNNKAVSAGRLFGRTLDNPNNYSSDSEKDDGLVYSWVPAGSTVIPQFDVLKPGDLRQIPRVESTIDGNRYVDLMFDDNGDQVNYAELSIPFRAMLTGINGESLVTVDHSNNSITIPFSREDYYPISNAVIWNPSSSEKISVLLISRDVSSMDDLYAEDVLNYVTFYWDETITSECILYVERNNGYTANSLSKINAGLDASQMVTNKSVSPPSWLGIPLAAYLGPEDPVTAEAVVTGYGALINAWQLEDPENVAVATTAGFAADVIGPPADVILHLDGAEDGSFTYSSGTNISGWLDRAGPYEHMTQTNYPTYGYPVRAGFQNGLKYVSKTAAGQCLQGVAVELYGHLPFSVVIVARRTATSQQSILFSTSPLGTGGVSIGYSSTGQIGFIDNPGIATHWTSTYASGDFEIITYLKNGTYGVGIGRSVLMLGNSVLFDADTVHNDSLTNTVIFEPAGGTGTADIAEILFYQRFLSDDDVLQAHAYLSNKWGI